MSDTLLGHLGHDLRNPGTTLVSCLELLRDVVRDPDGLEAVEDAELALEQLQRAWARVDVLAHHFDPTFSEDEELDAILERAHRVHGAAHDYEGALRVPRGLSFVLDGLLESTRTPRIEWAAPWSLRIHDPRGPIADAELRGAAFEIERQTEMKAAGRYSRFLGLVAAHIVATHVGFELVAAEDCVYRITRAA